MNDQQQLSCAEPRDPQAALDTDWRHLVTALSMIHRRVLLDQMSVQLEKAPVSYDQKRYLRDGLQRMIADILDAAIVVQPE